MSQKRLCELKLLSNKNYMLTNLEYENFIINFSSQKYYENRFKKDIIHQIKYIYYLIDF